MKKHTTYYIIGAVLVGAGVYLYGKNKKANTSNLTPPKEVEEKTPALSTPPYVSAYDALKKLLESLKIGGSKTQTTVPTNTTV